MIKLFWNTHNQRKNISTNKKNKQEEEINYKWGIYHKNSSNIWISEILEKVKYTTIENENNLEKNDIIIIVDSSPETKAELYNKLHLICSKILLIHLGDETGSYDLSKIYDKCTYVLRTFCSNKYFNDKKIKCIPLGYKSGIQNKKINIKKYKWAFTGTPHKSSRHDLLFQLSSINPSFCHRTEKFNKKILSTEKMSEIFSSTNFIPCPNGFYHPETYRLYEALQCGCIPIVENAYQYYDRLFPNNPFIKIDKWSEAKPIIQDWKEDEIKKKQNECEEWWNNYKNNLQEFINNKVS